MKRFSLFLYKIGYGFQYYLVEISCSNLHLNSGAISLLIYLFIVSISVFFERGGGRDPLMA